MKKYTTHKLSDPEIRHAKPKDKLYRLRDGGGLSCDILTTGKKVWRYAYRIHGKQKTYTIGTYPNIGLSDARVKRDEAKEKVKTGVDPSQQKQLDKKMLLENTFQAIAEKFLEQQKRDVTESTYTRTASYLKRDVFPILGKREISKILAHEIIPIIKAISDRGAVASAPRVKGFIQQVFDYALVHGKVERNPAKDINLKLILPKRVMD